MPSKSKSQQRFMGMVRAAQKGEKPASPEVEKAADSMKKSDVEDFASTKHKDLPEKKKVTESEILEMIQSIVREEMIEGFAGALKKEDRKKFDDARRKQAEVLGYKLTGTSDIKVEIDDATIKEEKGGKKPGNKHLIYVLTKELKKLKKVFGTKWKEGKHYTIQPNPGTKKTMGILVHNSSSNFNKVLQTLIKGKVNVYEGIIKESTVRISTMKDVSFAGRDRLQLLGKKGKVGLDRKSVSALVKAVRQILGRSFTAHEVTEEKLTEDKFIAFYKKDKVTITAKSLWDAKKQIIAKLKVPKKDVGLVSVLNKTEYDKQKFRFEGKLNEAKMVTLPNGVKVKIEFKGITLQSKGKKPVFLDRSEMMRFFKATHKHMKVKNEGGPGSGRPRAATPATDKDDKRPTKNPFSKESPAHKTWKKKKNEGKLSEDYKNSEWEVYTKDEKGREKIVKKAKSKRAATILYNRIIKSDDYYEVGMRVIKEGKLTEKKMDRRKAAEILKQIGGNRFIAMTGAKGFAFSDKYMSFKIGRNSKGINFVRIGHNAKDLYDMEFGFVSVRGIKVKKKVKDVYADMLGTMFKKYTGMNVRL